MKIIQTAVDLRRKQAWALIGAGWAFSCTILSSALGDIQTETFAFISEQTPDCIAVYGTHSVTTQQYDRAHADIQEVLGMMNVGLRDGLLNSEAKMLVVENEDELDTHLDYLMTLLPLEAVFTNLEGTDETLESPSGAGLSSTKLELMYLVVYYSLLTEPGLSDPYAELQQAYLEGVSAGFAPGPAYQDEEVDEIHQNASDNNALKFGSYLFNLYVLYFGDGTEELEEFPGITTKEQLQRQNPLGYQFVETYLAGTIWHPADADADGLPDEWEFYYFSELVSAGTDSDGDGQSNFEEYIAGTLPNNAASYFSVAMENVPSAFVLTWTAVQSRTYNVLWSDNLSSGFTLSTNLAYPANSYTDTVHQAESGGYYRVDVDLVVAP